MKLRAHQQQIVDDDPKRCGIFLGTGSGKTRIALLLARGKTLVIAPKTQVEDGNWEREHASVGERYIALEDIKKDEYGYVAPAISSLTVISKETFRRDHETLPAFDTVIFDESHTICGLTPNTRQRKKVQIPRASQLYEAASQFLQRTQPSRVYLCTATPTRNPMAVLAASWLLGDSTWGFYTFRSEFYIRLNMPGREVYAPKKDNESKEKLGALVRSIGYTGRLSDWMDVPEQTHTVKHIPLTGEQQKVLKNLSFDFPEPIVLLGKKHQAEQGVLAGDEFNAPQHFATGKIEAILDLLEEFPKVLIFAKYTAQISLIEEALRKAGIPTFVLQGATKDRGQLMKDAEASERCAVIAQAQISAGYELPSFRCTIFASESWSVVDHIQALGRTLRMNHLEKNLYVYLVSGEVDTAVREAIEDKQDFSERIYLKAKI